MSLAKNEYQCDRCRGVFTRGWSQADAQAEAVQDPFGFQTPPENDPFNGEMATICDDCFQQLKTWFAAHGGVEKAMTCNCSENVSCPAR